MIVIKYNGNPERGENSHFGFPSSLKEDMSKSFDNIVDAINFWYQCTYPQTSLLELRDEIKKKYQNVSINQITEILTICDIREENISLNFLTKAEEILNEENDYVNQEINEYF